MDAADVDLQDAELAGSAVADEGEEGQGGESSGGDGSGSGPDVLGPRAQVRKGFCCLWPPANLLYLWQCKLNPPLSLTSVSNTR